MSADNWATCPKCEIKFRKVRQKALDEVKNAYGKVPLEEYEEMVSVAHVNLVEDMDSTFREDYEIGIVEMEFEISYTGKCTECNFEYKFNFHKDLRNK